jgi:hypothetical protein
MSNVSSIQTSYPMPDLRRHGKRSASIPAAQAWPSPDRDRKPVARINDHSAAEAAGAY